MNKILSLIFLSVSTLGFSQSDGVGVGTLAPHESAQLHVESASKGVLIPRLDAAAILTLGTAAKAGLLVYNTDEHAFNYYDGSQWISFPQISLTELSDADGDTKVEVDRPADGTEDEIHFSTGGNSVAKINHAGPDLQSTTQDAEYQIGGEHAFSIKSTNSTFGGKSAGASHVAETKQTFVGADAGSFATGSEGNSVLGSGTLSTGFLGNYNTAIGASNASGLSNGGDNVFVGTENGASMTAASGNVVVGNNSLANLAVEHVNTVIGSNSGNQITGARNVVVGMNAEISAGTNESVNVGNVLFADAATGSVNFNRKYSFPASIGNSGAILVLNGTQLEWAEKIPKSVVSAAAELQPYDRGVASGSDAFASSNNAYYMEAFSFTTAEMNSFLTQIVTNTAASPATIRMAIYSDDDNDGTYNLDVYGQCLVPVAYTGVVSVKFGYQRSFSGGVLVDELLSDLGLPTSPESYEVQAAQKYYLGLWCSTTDITFKSLNKSNGSYVENHAGNGMPDPMSTGTTAGKMYWLRGYFE